MSYELTAPSNVMKTMTLKEITDLLGVRHDKAMLKVAKMAKEPDFGLVSKMDIQYESGKGRIDTIQTYQLDKRQSIAVAARLNTALLMRIVDRWQELEIQQQAMAAEAWQVIANLRASAAEAQAAAKRLESILAQCTPSQFPPQDACEADVIKYLVRKGEMPSYVFQRNRANAKPWSTIRPKSIIGEVMRKTFLELEKKGVITRIGNSIGYQAVQVSHVIVITRIGNSIGLNTIH